ncbi:MAG: hydroxymethylglutaryl-CoA lyase [Cytophagaceae bacterium]|nr:hydroxymethylglutaryl-CoA lyase [Cytophagaceae bacterium]MDW8457272.1 hydroxymethylglutaryl-CoA lyase [Cytophagaceae bacterium]
MSFPANEIKIIECPRDAMQGIRDFIPTTIKIKYLQRLLEVGFHTLDAGSFVSPKAVPQMSDTDVVLRHLDVSSSATKILAIVANIRGAEQASAHEKVHYVGYPLSVSEIFQKKNTNKTIAEALPDVSAIQDITLRNDKEFVVYLSMAFGNPYQEPYHEEALSEYVYKLSHMGISIISLADTVGKACTDMIGRIFRNLITEFPAVEFGAHFHSTPDTAYQKIHAAWSNGCRRFDVTLSGIGGCPFAEDKLTGNISTQALLQYCTDHNIPTPINIEALKSANQISEEIFSTYH